MFFSLSRSSYIDNTDPGQVNVGLAALAQSRPTAGQPQVNYMIIQYTFSFIGHKFISIVWNASILLSASNVLSLAVVMLVSILFF